LKYCCYFFKPSCIRRYCSKRWL